MSEIKLIRGKNEDANNVYFQIDNDEKNCSLLMS